MAGTASSTPTMDNQPAAFDEEAREPPNSTEAEQCVIGSLWYDNAVLPLLSDLVAAESFYHHAHRCIYSATLDILAAGQPADMITVLARLQSQGLADRCGGLKYLNEIAAIAVQGRHVRRYAQIVAETYASRALITACSDALQAGSNALQQHRLGRAEAVAVARTHRVGEPAQLAPAACGTLQPLAVVPADG